MASARPSATAFDASAPGGVEDYEILAEIFK
jgi:hypothetical protein